MQDTLSATHSTIKSQAECLTALEGAKTIGSQSERLSLLTNVINFLVRCETPDLTLITKLDAYFDQIGITKEKEKFLTPQTKLLLRIKNDLKRKLAGTHTASTDNVNDIINILTSRTDALTLHIKYPYMTQSTPERTDIQNVVFNEDNIFKLRQVILPSLNIKNGELYISNSESLDQQKCFIFATTFTEHVHNFPEVLSKLSENQFKFFLLIIDVFSKTKKIDNANNFIHNLAIRLVDAAVANKLTLNPILSSFIKENLKPAEDAHTIAVLATLMQRISLDPKEVTATKSRQSKTPPANDASALIITKYALAKASRATNSYNRDIPKLKLSVVDNNETIPINSAEALEKQLKHLGVKERLATTITKTFDKTLILVGNNYLLKKLLEAGLNPGEQYSSIIDSTQLEKRSDGQLQLVIKSKIRKETPSEVAAEITTILKITSEGNNAIAYNLSTLNYALYDNELEEKFIHAAYSKIINHQQLSSDELALLNKKTDLAIQSIMDENSLIVAKFNNLSPVMKFLVAYKKPAIAKAFISNREDFSGPRDILAGLVYHNKLTLKECYALKPLGSTKWEKQVTQFALSPRNSKLQLQLHELLRAEIGKDQAPITEQFNLIKNPTGFFRTGITGSVIDFCVKVLSVAYETNRYKENLQRKNAMKISQSLNLQHSEASSQNAKTVSKFRASADVDAKRAIAVLDGKEQDLDAFVAARNAARQSNNLAGNAPLNSPTSFQPSH